MMEPQIFACVYLLLVLKGLPPDIPTNGNMRFLCIPVKDRFLKMVYAQTLFNISGEQPAQEF